MAIDRLPNTIGDSDTLCDAVANTPQGAGAAMVLARPRYSRGEALGRRCLTIAVDRERLV